ncbi:Wadjet anti-phage system protein JetD domain-containing protein [Pseudoxanthomonas mexicana]|uniref:Wadjet anti-phage system protein JetD domain-containing protein n=1 Tax=Pseudoxanthomonas mexicana TaxID=128785 RepID=UPI00398AAE8F
MPLVDEVLADLLRRGERARLRGSDRAIQTAFTGTDSAYWQQGYEQRQHCHVRFIAAERAGAVGLEWSRQGGEDRPLEKVRLRDVDRLATFLGTATASESVQAAQAILDPWLAGYPRVAELLEAWTRLKSPRGLGTDSARDFADALQVLEALKQGGGDDQIVRVLSRRLFQDTKRIEALSRHIDLLTAEHLSSLARQQEEVFGELGLLKEPQPFLVAGTGRLELSPSQDCPIAWPFIGVSNRHVVGYSGTPAWVLSIENLTTFHLASQHPDAAAGLILFTGGMPSPSWCRAYANILDSLPESTPVYHWSDIDQGGFRIAAHIRNRCIRRHAFHPWLMDVQQLDGTAYSETTEATRTRMARHARDAGWERLSQDLPPQTIEQEGIAIRLPTST